MNCASEGRTATLLPPAEEFIPPYQSTISPVELPQPLRALFPSQGIL